MATLDPLKSWLNQSQDYESAIAHLCSEIYHTLKILTISVPFKCQNEPATHFVLYPILYLRCSHLSSTSAPEPSPVLDVW